MVTVMLLRFYLPRGRPTASLSAVSMPAGRGNSSPARRLPSHLSSLISHLSSLLPLSGLLPPGFFPLEAKKVENFFDPDLTNEKSMLH